MIGGAVAGLAAAERLREFADVTLFERQTYDDKRVNCGEAINDARLVPLESTPANGFRNRVDGFDVSIHASTDRASDADPLARAHVGVDHGYVTDRDIVERRWAERLAADDSVAVRAGENVTVSRFRDCVREFDYVVDATGQPSLWSKARDRTDAYTGDIVALNADVRGDFGEYRRRPRILFEGYVGYFWVFPKSDSRANVGIGWAGEHRPDDYVAELWAACDRAGVQRPDRDAIEFYTIPRGPSLDPDLATPESGVYLVGDAAGVANRYQGEGICQAIRSSYLLAALLEQGRGEEYPDRLYGRQKSEYVLAAAMRAVWETTEDPDLLASVARSIDGLTVEAVTREPLSVASRIVRRPRTLARVLGSSEIIRRSLLAALDRWEYNSPPRWSASGG